VVLKPIQPPLKPQIPSSSMWKMNPNPLTGH
jgi:hypothetical protein